MKKRRIATEQNMPSIADVESIDIALNHLRVARRLLRNASAIKAAEHVARAIKSTDGAMRHATNLRARFGARSVLRRGEVIT
jgi:hypothetical protein